MSKIATSPETVLDNIARFQREIKKSTDLQDRLAYARAWYATRDKKGEWQFGPSKFVGYHDLDAIEYIKTSHNIDGRRTEAQLQQWFTILPTDSELHAELSEALSSFLGRYGKAPSTAMRINILHGVYQEYVEREAPDATAAIVDLIVAVAKTLPLASVTKLKERLAA